MAEIQLDLNVVGISEYMDKPELLASDYLKRINEQLGISDYRVAKVMDCATSTIYRYKNDPKATFSNEQALKIAKLLEIDPLGVIASMEVIKSKSSQTKKFWQRIADQYS